MTAITAQPMMLGNENAKKHNAYGLKKRVETGLTTKDDYTRYVALLDKWGKTPADIEEMGMLGSAIEIKAWQVLIAKDGLGAYFWVKENYPDDVELIIRLQKNAQYQLSKAGKDLVALQQILQGDDGAIEAALASIKNDNEHINAD